MSVVVRVEKIDTRTYLRKMVEEPVATEAPLNVFVNDRYVITLLATPKLQKELALGWLFTEGVLQSLDEIKKSGRKPRLCQSDDEAAYKRRNAPSSWSDENTYQCL
jgi:formate dehydrogenase assembly factor FdhD